MKLTTQELEQMKSVDIGAVAAESLPDVSGMTFDNALSRKERISRFLQTVKNPYCFSAATMKTAHADRILRFTILSSARWTCPNDRLPYPIPKTSIG